MVFGIIFAVIVGFLVYVLLKQYIVIFTMPPGPFPVPIIGNYMDRRKRHIVIADMMKKYGDIITVFIGPRANLILNSAAAMKEVLIDDGDSWSDRGKIVTVTAIMRPAVLFENGPNWRDNRRFALKTMRDFGMGRSTGEERILEEAEVLIQAFTTKEAISPAEQIQTAVNNVICRFIFGHPFDYDDVKQQQLLVLMRVVFNRGLQLLDMFTNLLESSTLAKYYPSQQSLDFLVIREELGKMIEAEMHIHEKTLNIESPRDFIDMYLAGQKDHSIGGSLAKLDVLQGLVFDLFLAGSETTSTVLSWTLLYLAKHPDVMRKCQEEIDEVILEGQLPKTADRPKLKYLEAVMNETQRVVTIFPMGVFHSSSREATVRGYTIPTNTLCVTNLWAIHHDEKFWPEPHAFKPERWLDVEGNLINHASFCPFGVGRRICLGESLAKMEYYLLLASILTRFTFELAAPASVDDGVFGVTLLPPPFKLNFIPRE